MFRGLWGRFKRFLEGCWILERKWKFDPPAAKRGDTEPGLLIDWLDALSAAYNIKPNLQNQLELLELAELYAKSGLSPSSYPRLLWHPDISKKFVLTQVDNWLPDKTNWFTAGEERYNGLRLSLSKMQSESGLRPKSDSQPTEALQAGNATGCDRTKHRVQRTRVHKATKSKRVRRSRTRKNKKNGPRR